MIRRFFQQSWFSFKGEQSAFNFEEFLFLETTYPILELIFYVVLASYSFNTSNLTHWVVGNAFLLCVSACIFNIGNTFTYERIFGRLRYIFASPANKLGIIFQKGLFPCLLSIITVNFGFIVGSLIFKVDFSTIDLRLFLLITIIAMISATGFGLLLAITGLLTDQVHFILNLSQCLLILFSGANFPITQFPVVIQKLTYLLPLVKSIQAADMLFGEMNWLRFYMLLVGELLTGLTYCVIGFFLIKFIEKKAVQNASYDVF